MKVLKDFKNDLLKRREISIVIKADKNPSFIEAVDMIEKEFKVDKELIVARNIKGKFGRKTFLITAYIYDSKEAKESIEPKPEKKEGEGGEQAAPAQAPPEESPTEAPKEEAPAEEKKEESKEEEKKE